MTTIPTAPIPVTGLVEVVNTIGDSLCVSARGTKSWSVQVIRQVGRGRRSRASMEFLYREAEDELALKEAVDAFLEGKYEGFEKAVAENPQRWRVLLSTIGMLLLTLLGITFLAFMISLFLRMEW